MTHLLKLILLTLFTIGATSIYGQTTYTSFDASGNWSTDGGSTDCSCTPTAGPGNHIIVNHNACTGTLAAKTGCHVAGSVGTLANYASVTVNSGGALYIEAGFNSGGAFTLQDITINSGGDMYVFGGSSYFADVNLTINGNFTQFGGSNFYTNNWILNGTVDIVGGSNCFGCDITGTGSFGSCGTLSAVTFGTTPLINGTNESGNNICGVPLPVKFGFFEGQETTDGVLLSWSTLTEKNNDFFTIERSHDAYSFESVGITQGEGTSHSQNFYDFTDYEPLSAINYYRLKQTDYNGDFSYSKIIAMNNQTAKEVKTFPNPANHSITVKFPNNSDNTNSNESVQLFDYQYVTQKIDLVKVNTNTYTIDVNEIATGFYFVEYYENKLPVRVPISILH